VSTDKNNEKKIRICYFLGSLQAAGAEDHVLQLVKNIDRSKYIPFICVFQKQGLLLPRFTRLNIPIFEFKVSKTNVLFKFICFTAFLRNNEIDLIHVHLTGCFIFALSAAFFAKTKTKIISWHNTYSYPYGERKLVIFLLVGHWGYFSKRGVLIVSSVKTMSCPISLKKPSLRFVEGSG